MTVAASSRHKWTYLASLVLSCCTVLHGEGNGVPKTGRRRKQREPFGRIRQLPSRRYQAAFTGPDLALHKAAATFGTLMDARAWLAEERRRIDVGEWIAPERRNHAQQAATLRAFAVTWLADR